MTGDGATWLCLMSWIKARAEYGILGVVCGYADFL